MCTPDNQMLSVEHLLPLRSMVVTLRFLDSSRPRFYHQAGISAFVRYLLDSPDDFDTQLVIDTPESGRVNYQKDDYYRFTVIALQGSETLLETLVERLRRLPWSVPSMPSAIPFRDNIRLVALHDSFNEQPVETANQLCAYTNEELDQEADLWARQTHIHWHWLSPARLLRDKQERGNAKGEARYCRDFLHLDAELLFNRLYDTTADLLRRRGCQTPPRQSPPSLDVSSGHLFWVDSEYTDSQQKNHSMGGMLGHLALKAETPLPDSWTKLLIMGQFTGLGQRRAFGFGRFELVTQEGGVTYRRGLPAFPLLSSVVAPHNLHNAFKSVASKQQKAPEYETAADAITTLAEAEQLANDWHNNDCAPPSIAPIDSDDYVESKLKDLGNQLLNGQYRVPKLYGCTIPKPGGGLRALAIPPFWDRVMQRAVAQVLRPALEQITNHSAHGYRPGRSRLTARDAIQRAWRQGYHWVFEADIEDFFSSVSWQRVHDRLRGLYYDDPLVEWIMSWLQAPINVEDKTLQRQRGLPQGSPLSPLIANLLLDDFDNDLQAAGFKLVRYADDFVVMCKSQSEAQAAAEAVRNSLQEHGLSLHPEKTRTLKASDGFKFLGYLFVNDMALDVGGQQGKISLAPNESALQGLSWFAQLGTGQSSAPSTEKLPLTADNTDPENDNNSAGERGEYGTFVCVTGDSTIISSRANRIHVERDGQCLIDTPWQGTQALLLIGDHHITTPALRNAMSNQVAVHFCSRQGYYQGTTWEGKTGALGHQLWLTQLDRANDMSACLYIARCLTQKRIETQAELLRQRGISDWQPVKHQASKLQQCTSLQQINGIEGYAARLFYGQLANWLPDEWQFNGRNRRPPKDPFNVLLSLGYSTLYAYSESIIRVSGLLPWQGFYHQPHGTHAALASDLMEPFRHLVERVALSQISLKQRTIDDFTTTADGQCHIKPTAKRQYTAALLKRFNEPKNPTDQLPLRLHQQSRSLIQWLQGDKAFTAGGKP